MKKIIILTVFFMLMGAASSFAQTPKKHSWDLSGEVSYIEYEEPDVMEEKGVMAGVVGSYTYRNDWMLRGEGRFSFGQVDYEGSGTLDGVDDYMLEFRGLVGRDYMVMEATTLTPYTGLGYRYLNDDLKGITSTGARGYERESNYLYSPIGVETMTLLDGGMSVGATIEYDIFWMGLQKSHLSDTGLGLGDIENDQDSGYGLRGSVKFQKEGEKFSFILEPFIRYWNIKKSEETNLVYSGTIVGYGYEPKNTSTEIGLRYTLKY